jgi:hypothetical protein
MGILSKGTTFATGDQITATKLNNLVDSAIFTSDAVVFGGGLSLTTGNAPYKLFISDLGVTEAKLATNSVSTTKIADATITPAKLSTYAPTWSSTATTIANSLDFASISSSTTGSYTRTGYIITVSMIAHGMSNGTIVTLDFTSGTGSDGSYIISGVTTDQFTVTDTVSGTTSGNCTRTSYYGNSRVRGSQTIDGNLSVAGSASITGNLNLNGSAVNLLTRGTVQNTTSGTSIDFTSIPSWVKRVTLILNGLSTNGTSMIFFRLGTGGTPATSGYVASASTIGSNDNTSASSDSTAGIPISGYSISAGSTFYGNVIFTNISGNTWLCSGIVTGGTSVSMLAGSIALGGVLDILRITTSAGTSTFDAGSANILYE